MIEQVPTPCVTVTKPFDEFTEQAVEEPALNVIAPPLTLGLAETVKVSL